jgi:hypothetical protein
MGVHSVAVAFQAGHETAGALSRVIVIFLVRYVSRLHWLYKEMLDLFVCSSWMIYQSLWSGLLLIKPI